jgi:hypothetical protein
MQRYKTLGAAFTALLALTALLSAITAATASAELPEFLPGTAGTKFTSLSGPGTLQTEKKGEIHCEKDEDEGVLLSSTEALVTVDFLKCHAHEGALEAPIRSLGDPKETILVHLETLLCYINKANKEVGVNAHILPLHLEVESSLVKKLYEVIGWAIGKITPVNTPTLSFLISWKQTGGVQALKKCEGRVEETLLTSENGGAFEKSGEQTEDTIGFLVSEQTLMA